MCIKDYKIFWAVVGLCGCLVAGLSGPVFAGALGNPFQVNNYTPGAQYVVDISSGAGGDTLVLWRDTGRGNYTFMQRFNSTGEALQSDEWYLGNNVTAGAVDRFGRFVVVKAAPDGSGNGIFATVYDRSGNIYVPEFRVNVATAGEQNAPYVAMNANGSFVITWNSGSGKVVARRFNYNGTPATGDINVSNTTNNQSPMGIGIDKYGNFAVTWFSQVPRTNKIDVYVRRYGSTGTALSSAVLVNTYKVGIQVGNSIALAPNGSFVVVWESYAQDGDSYGIYGQRFTASGVRAGPEFRVNTITEGMQYHADVAMMDDGSFAVTWELDNRENDPNSLPTVYVRQYRADGTPVSPETVVNTLANSKAFVPKIGMDLAGNFMIGWWHYDVATGDTNLEARRYVMDTLPPTAVLNNGQTLSGLSAAAGSWRYFKIRVPSGVSNLTFNQYGSTGDADLVVRWAALPTVNDYDDCGCVNGNTEQLSFSNPPAGDWYIGIYGYQSYTEVGITANFY